MGVDEGNSGGYGQQSQFPYGTFQGVANYHPPPPYPPPHYNPASPVVGFPQPTPPPGLSPYSCGYQSVPVQGYIAVVEGRHVRDRLFCCGLGVGWLLFISGFFLGAIPWYIGAFILIAVRVDPREKPGYIACLIGAALASIAFIFGLTDQYW